MSYLALILLSLQVITVPIPIEMDHVKGDDGEKVEEKRYSECVDYDRTIQPHFNYYYELIVEKYRPDLAEEWEQVLSERGAINKKLQEFSHKQRKELYRNISEDWYHKHELFHVQFLSAVKDREGEKIKKMIPHILTLKKSWNSEMRELFKEQ